LNFNNLKARGFQNLPEGDAGNTGQLGKVKVQKTTQEIGKLIKNIFQTHRVTLNPSTFFNKSFAVLFF